jgi:hypothetical protein
MRDLEQELENTMARAYDSNGQPREGFYNLTRQMENEAEEQFDVDHTILDFLVYKAISVIFEWHVSTDRYHSDLPNALVTMTVGKWYLQDQDCKTLTVQNGGHSCLRNTKVDV